MKELEQFIKSKPEKREKILKEIEQAVKKGETA